MVTGVFKTRFLHRDHVTCLVFDEAFARHSIRRLCLRMEMANLPSPNSRQFFIPESYPHRPANGVHDSERETSETPARQREIRKRQPAEEGGFKCKAPGCGKVFDRQSDLSKHEKYHLPEEERPFKCELCSKRFLFQKDLRRHEQTPHAEPKIGAGISIHEPSALTGKANGHITSDVSRYHSPIESSYHYQPLIPDQIRILRLLPAGKLTTNTDYGQVTGDIEPIRCEIVHSSLEEACKAGYEALSYLWGAESTRKTILTNGQRLHVTPTLFDFLGRLRLEDRPRNLWVDAICINQADVQEKSAQVSMMARIHSQASSVCIWLGDDYDRSDLALDFIQNTVLDLGALEDITADSKFAEEWKALAALMNRPWFTRRWVISMILHARSATLYCGSRSIQWSDFEMAVALFEREAARIAKIFHGSEKAEYDPEFFGDVQAMGATRLVRAKSKLFRRDDANNIIEYKYGLSDLVRDLSSFETSYPHDTIYAILSLARDTCSAHMGRFPGTHPSNHSSRNKKRKLSQVNSVEASSATTGGSELRGGTVETSRSTEAEIDPVRPASDLRSKSLAMQVIHKLRSKRQVSSPMHKLCSVDYAQEFFEVCKQFMDFSIRHSKGSNNLDILCTPWAPIVETSPALPSWVSTVANSAFELRAANFAPGGRQLARKNHDSLVQDLDGERTVYNACRDQRAFEWRFGDAQEDESELSLFLYGFEIDSIGEIEVYAQLGNVPEEWFTLAGWSPRSPKSSATEQLWRTLIADRGPDGSTPKVYYSKAFEFAVENSTPGAGLETTNLMKRSNPILVEFLKRMAAVVWNRSLFKSAGYNLLGLAPKKARSGDSEYIHSFFLFEHY